MITQFSGLRDRLSKLAIITDKLIDVTREVGHE